MAAMRPSLHLRRRVDEAAALPPHPPTTHTHLFNPNPAAEEDRKERRRRLGLPEELTEEEREEERRKAAVGAACMGCCCGACAGCVRGHAWGMDGWAGEWESRMPASWVHRLCKFATGVKQPSTADRGNGSPAQAKAEEERRRKLPIKPVEGGAQRGAAVYHSVGQEGQCLLIELQVRHC